MDYQIQTERPWRYRHPKNGFSVLDPGVYNVPHDLPANLAELALAQGVARKMTPPAAPAPVKPVETIAEGPRKRGRRKGKAPENKALDAPENK